jgi:hypothetical protein
LALLKSYKKLTSFLFEERQLASSEAEVFGTRGKMFAADEDS